jgi:hypothetical protein
MAPGFDRLSPNGACVARYNRPIAPQFHPMAHIIPEGWQALEAAGAAQREIETWHCSPRRCPTPEPSITVCTGRASTRVTHWSLKSASPSSTPQMICC